MLPEEWQAKTGKQNPGPLRRSAIRRAVPLRPRTAVSVTQKHFARCLLTTYVGLGSVHDRGAAEKRNAGAAPPALRERPAGPLAPDVAVVTVRV